jgi:hypothetical protein
MEQSMRDLSIEEKKAQFRKVAITHRLLEQTDRAIMRAIREPAGFAIVLVHGPTGVGKTKMIEVLSERIKRQQPSPQELPFASLFHQTSGVQIPLLLIETRPPDGSAFDRAYYYRTALTLMGERTYQQQMHIDIHADQPPPKRRPLRGKAAQFNDVAELREATEEAMRRHGVRAVILDEAHHMLYGTVGSTLQEHLEWLKSMSNTTGVLYILAGTYDLFNFGRLNGQLSRRCLPVHFPRYQLQREEDCIEFQAALLALLQKVPLNCDAETFTREYWLYFYECSIGCIGVLKDWLLRAVSTALDEGLGTLTLDWIQDYAPPVDIYRQMALDATEGEQKLRHTESNREHVWRLLQGGELIAPVPPLPPRGMSALPSSPNGSGVMSREDEISQPSSSSDAVDVTPTPPVKKTRSRKKAEVPPKELEQEIVIQAEPGAEPGPEPPRRRRKKTPETVVEEATPEVKALSSLKGEESSGLIDAADATSPTQPKRTRRVGERKPKRDPVGDQETARRA